MALPTDGFTVRSVTYTLGTDNGLSISLDLSMETFGARTAADELLPYLEAALTGFRTAYEGGTANTVNFIERRFSGDLQGAL